MWTVRKIIRTVRDEPSAVQFLQEHNLIPRNKDCENGHNMKLHLGKLSRWRCNVKSCGKTQGLRSGTWLANSTIPLETVVHFIFFWTIENTSIKFCDTQLNMSKNTTVDWSNYMREVCVFAVEKQSTCIGGEGRIVEIDESLYTRRKNNTGRVLPQQWIFGGLCRETNECFIVRVPDRSANTLLPIIMERVRPGTTIVSDCWKGYSGLQKQGFQHLTVNHKYNFVDPETLANTQRVERLWGAAKWGNKKRRGTHRQLLDSYLAEFMWRNNLKGRDPFEEILSDIVQFSESQ